jgi:hypothetical protein
MSESVKWSATRTGVRELDPEGDSPERVAAREVSREQPRAESCGVQLAEMRKRLRVSQKLQAERMGISQANCPRQDVARDSVVYLTEDGRYGRQDGLHDSSRDF